MRRAPVHLHPPSPLPRFDRGGTRAGLILSPGPSSLGQALGAVAIVLADGAMNDLADTPTALWRPWVGLAVAMVGIHAIWEIARMRRIVAGPAGVHWSGGLSPSAGSVGWEAVRRIDALHDRFGTRWHIEVLDGPARPRLVTLRGPGRWADLRVRTPERLSAWWEAAGRPVRVSRYHWGWRLESAPPVAPGPPGR